MSGLVHGVGKMLKTDHIVAIVSVDPNVVKVDVDQLKAGVTWVTVDPKTFDAMMAFLLERKEAREVVE